jgi:hypothetical protein
MVMAEWYETLDADSLTHAASKGWNKPAGEVVADIFKSHRSAQSLIGSDPAAIVKLPKDATDPSYASIYDRVVGLGLPKSADEYKFDGIKFKDGTEFDAEDQALVRKIATTYKLTPAQARGVAAELAANHDAALEAGAGSSATAKAANDAALHSAWATDYDRNAAGASTVLDALKAKGVNVSFDGLDPAAHVAQMSALFQLSQELRESPMLRGASGNTAAAQPMTREQATAKIAELSNDRAWGDKAWNQPASPEAQQFRDLQAYAAGTTPEKYAAFLRGERVQW